MRDFITFDRMITPALVQAAFIIGSALLVLGGLFAAGAADGAASVWGGLAVAVFGPLVLRIYCEVVIVVFKIHEAAETVAHALDGMADRLAGSEARGPAAPGV